MIRLIVAVLACGLLTGCGIAGADHRAAAASSATGTPTYPPLPPRPGTFPIEQIDPCNLFTTQQMTGLGLPVKGKRGTVDDGQGGHHPDCIWNYAERDPALLYQTVVNLSQPANAALWSTRPASVVTIAGFPAVETQNVFDDPDNTCTEFLDLADNGYVAVGFDHEGDPSIGREQACVKARAAAEIVLKNLTTRFPG